MGMKEEFEGQETFFLICFNCGFRQTPTFTKKEQSNTRMTHYCNPAIFERSCNQCDCDVFRLRSKNYED